jgi:hypothetical protein
VRTSTSWQSQIDSGDDGGVSKVDGEVLESTCTVLVRLAPSASAVVGA